MRILCGLYGAALFPSFFLWLGAPFLFDAPGATESAPTVVLAVVLLVLPAALLLSCVGGLVSTLGAASRAKSIAGWTLAALPPLVVLVMAGDLWWLQHYCGGALACRP